MDNNPLHRKQKVILYLIKFYNNTRITGRKIIFCGPFDAGKTNEIVTVETFCGRKTPRFYDYVMDENGWEYHDEYSGT